MTKSKMMFNAVMLADETAELYIYDEIKPDSYDWLSDEVIKSDTSANAIRETLDSIKNAKKLNIYISSCGGSIKEGLAIYTQLQRFTAEKTAYIDGWACSIASVIPMACDKIVMYSVSKLMIHNGICGCYGNAVELRKAADTLDEVSKSALEAYVNRSNGKKSREEFQQMMNDETWISAEDALAWGLCDEIADKPAEISDKTAKQKLENSQAMMKADFGSGTDDSQMKSILDAIAMLTEKVSEFEKRTEQVLPVQKSDVNADNGTNIKKEKILKAFQNFCN